MNNYFFYGINVVKNLIKFKYNFIKEIFLSKNRNDLKFKNIKYLSNKYFIKINLVNKNYFNYLSNKNINHQGVLAFLNNKIFNFNENDLIKILKKKNSFILILDRINDPYNLGSCIRTAVAFNVDCIITSKKHSVSIYNNIVHKTSSGSIYKINIFECNNLCKIINLLYKYNFYIVGTCLKSINLLNNFNNNYSKLSLILGSENKGIKKNIKKKCNILLKVPIFNINSLNISVANGIFLYKLLSNNK